MCVIDPAVGFALGLQTPKILAPPAIRKHDVRPVQDVSRVKIAREGERAIFEFAAIFAQEREFHDLRDDNQSRRNDMSEVIGVDMHDIVGPQKSAKYGADFLKAKLREQTPKIMEFDEHNTKPRQ